VLCGSSFFWYSPRKKDEEGDILPGIEWLEANLQIDARQLAEAVEGPLLGVHLNDGDTWNFPIVPEGCVVFRV